MKTRTTALIAALTIGVALFLTAMLAGCHATVDDARSTVIAITGLHKIAEDELVRYSAESQAEILERAQRTGDKAAGLAERDAFRSKRDKVEAAYVASLTATKALAEAVRFTDTHNLKPLIASALDAAMRLREALASFGVTWLTSATK